MIDYVPPGPRSSLQRGGLRPSSAGSNSAGQRVVNIERERLARGWRKTLQVMDRLRRLEERRPLLELVRQDTPGPV